MVKNQLKSVKVSGLYLMWCMNREEEDCRYICELLYTLPGEDRTYDDFEQEYGKENIDSAVKVFSKKYKCDKVEISSEIYEYDKLPL